MRACVRAVWMPSEITPGVWAGTFPFPFSPAEIDDNFHCKCACTLFHQRGALAMTADNWVHPNIQYTIEGPVATATLGLHLSVRALCFFYRISAHTHTI